MTTGKTRPGDKIKLYPVDQTTARQGGRFICLAPVPKTYIFELYLENGHKTHAKYDFQVIFKEIWEIYGIKWDKIVLCATFVHKSIVKQKNTVRAI